MRQASGETRDGLFDRALADLPAALRWREFMRRIEGVLFASSTPVSRETLARVVGTDCSLELLIDDLVDDLRDRPYTVVAVAGGWQMRTRPGFASTMRAAQVPVRFPAPTLSAFEMGVLAAIAYQQPVTRGALSTFFGRAISRDLIAALREAGLIANGPRSPSPGAPATYVTTSHFLSVFGLPSLRDLPEPETLEETGLRNQGPRLIEAASNEVNDTSIG
nr:SMC-Scp complex subunit ScpB [Ochrobactrum sp. SFR4]